MTYSEEQRKFYNKGYYAGYRAATLDHLGPVCVLCGETQRGQLEIDHDPPLNRQRPRTLKDLADLSKVRVLCKPCNRKEEAKQLGGDDHDEREG